MKVNFNKTYITQDDRTTKNRGEESNRRQGKKKNEQKQVQKKRKANNINGKLKQRQS